MFRCPACHQHDLRISQVAMVYWRPEGGVELFMEAYAVYCESCSLVSQLDRDSGDLTDLSMPLSHVHAGVNIVQPVTRLHRGES